MNECHYRCDLRARAYPAPYLRVTLRRYPAATLYPVCPPLRLDDDESRNHRSAESQCNWQRPPPLYRRDCLVSIASLPAVGRWPSQSDGPVWVLYLARGRSREARPAGHAYACARKNARKARNRTGRTEDRAADRRPLAQNKRRTKTDEDVTQHPPLTRGPHHGIEPGLRSLGYAGSSGVVLQ